MRKINKYRLLFAGTFFALIIGTIVRLIFYDQDSVFLNTGTSFEKLFTNSVLPNLKFDYGYANKEDTICSYTYTNEYKIVAIEIGKYKDINIKNINLSSVSNIPNFLFAPYLGVDISKDLSIMKKTINQKGRILSIKIKKDTKIFENSNNGIYMLTQRIGIGYPEEKSNIIFDFHNGYKEVNLAIRQQNKLSVIIILYSLRRKELGSNILEKLLAYDNKI